MTRRFPTTVLSLFLILGACQPAATGTPGAATPAPRTATSLPSKTPVAVSKLGVQESALDGITLDVWHPWYGVPASLFESQVDEFNQSNAFGSNRTA